MFTMEIIITSIAVKFPALLIAIPFAWTFYVIGFAFHASRWAFVTAERHVRFLMNWKK
jgi:hypothetical protein